MKVDITRPTDLDAILDQLQESAVPAWGQMQPQHMIEHLAMTLALSGGKMQLTQKTTEQEAQAIRAALIYSDMEMAKGIKSSLMGDVPPPFAFDSLSAAKQNLKAELDNFAHYFQQHPDATTVHPRLGSLTYQEWIVLHNKHFTHHFKQFGLL